MFGKLKDGLKLWGIWRNLKMPKSWKKLAATALGAVVVAVGPQVGLTPEQCQWIAGMLAAFIIGQGAADAGAYASGAKK